MTDREKTAAQAEMLANRVRKLSRQRRRWAERAGVSCYRIYDRDIPEIPVCIDWYEGRLHIAEYARRKTAALSPADHERWLEALVSAAAQAVSVDRGAVFVKQRQRQRGRRQYERFDDQGAELVVREGGLEFLVNLSDYLDTGLFLDHRLTRDRVRREAEGQRVLNLFAYTGSFTVYAAHGGARATTTVDLSGRYLDWARRNLELNGLLQPRHRLIRSDVLRFVTAPERRYERYDLAVLDPPTFSNSKRMRSHFDVRADHPELIRRVLDLLVPGGVLYFSTNARKFRLEERRIGPARVQDITEETIPADFRDRRIHRCFRIVRTTGRRRPGADGADRRT